MEKGGLRRPPAQNCSSPALNSAGPRPGYRAGSSGSSRRWRLTRREPFCLRVVTMLMRVRGTAALVAACAGVCAPASAAAPPQGTQANATFAASYAQRGVTSVAATTERVSCYAPQVYYTGRLEPAQGYPDGGSTLCNGAASTGENIGPFSIQDVSNSPLRAKDF